MRTDRRKLHIALFAGYCALMLWLLFGRSGYTEGIPYLQQMKVNLVPFRTLNLYIRLLSHHRPHLVRTAIVNLVGNVVMFIPLGAFLPFVFLRLRKLWKTLLCAALIICVVELLQLLTLVGSCDIDDLILNIIGAALGFTVYYCAKKPT